MARGGAGVTVEILAAFSVAEDRVDLPHNLLK